MAARFLVTIFILGLVPGTIHSHALSQSNALVVLGRFFRPRAHHAKENIESLSQELNIRPYTNVPKVVWKFAWRGHSRILPLLHFRDPAAPKDASQSLKVLWNKAISALDRKSPAYEIVPYTYYMLPRSSRWLLRLFRPLFPRLHHANIETRSAYLNKCVQDEIKGKRKVRLVSIGAGYDTRSVRLLTENVIDQAWELDLSTLESKSIMFQRLLKKIPNARLPEMRQIDLNDTERFRAILEEVLADPDYHTIFLSEAVLIYLNDGVPAKVLATCAEMSKGSASLCFADLLGINESKEEDAREYLSKLGWDLKHWRPKPGLARHMGIARLSTNQ